MKRVYRLQSIGGSLYVALPREWLKNLGLSKGSPIEISIEADGSIKIKPMDIGDRFRKDLNNRISIDIKDVKSVFNIVITSYLRGFDIITINFVGGSMEKEVKRILDDIRQILLGLEVIDMDSNSVTLQVLSTVESNISNLIRNMGKIARSMYIDAINALIDRDRELAEAIPLRDFDLNRLYFYVTRTIRKKMALQTIDYRELLELVDLRMTAKAIEEIGDEAKKAAKAIAQLIQLNGTSNEVIHSLKEDVDGLDKIFGKIIKKGFASPIDIVELYKDMMVCEELKRSLSKTKNNITGNTAMEYTLFKIIDAYENIATRIYDVLSLTPLKLETLYTLQETQPNK